MTETAGNIILDAYKELVAIPSEAAIPASKVQAGLFYLNAMMDDFAVTGINLGFTSVDSLSDIVTVVDGALEGIVKNLALEISPSFKATLTSGDLFDQAQTSLDVLRQISFDRPGQTPYSENLPTGSGNYDYNGDRFYSVPDDPLFTEVGGNIAPEAVDES